MKKAALILGSDSDLPIAEKAFAVLEKLGIDYTAHVMSAHRTPMRVMEFARAAEAAGYGCLICFAGKAAHLAGVSLHNRMLAESNLTVTGDSRFAIFAHSADCCGMKLCFHDI